MNIGKVFWRPSAALAGTGEVRNSEVGMSLAVDRRVWIHPLVATEETNFTLFVSPGVFDAPVPAVDSLFVCGGRRTFSPILYTFASPDVQYRMESTTTGARLAVDQTEAKPDCFPHLIFDPAPRWMEVLLDLAEKHYAPLVDEDGRRANRKLFAFLDYGDVADQFSPKEFERQSFVVAALWPTWEARDLAWDARAAELQSVGVTFNVADGTKNTDALEKRCRRLGLKRRDAI